ncbi:aquaporin Z [Silvanigrella aquatica]|uniref:Aquaporin Z n=1 Tax=Silvanigrella aquatica TaxID=1915309 RepID=A0A1L4D051_9BACT|nr:aquaporin Z [Silvanigrella aquatica]APJ03557.1 aquaporin Z [Silvanigrella aquatica]
MKFIFDIRKMIAEFIGTFWLVLGGCGSAVLAAGFPNLGIGFVGVSFAFGLTVLTMAFSLGSVSGCHLNPAVSLGLAVSGRFRWLELPSYVLSQVVGAIVASAILYIIVSGKADFTSIGGFASNGYGDHSPGGFSPISCFICEVVMTAIFLFVILGSTDPKSPGSLAPISIGLCLTLIHLISIPVTNTSVNPARSTGPALFAGDWATDQLWMFWLAPLMGAALGALLYNYLYQIKLKMPVKPGIPPKPNTPQTPPAKPTPPKA